MVVVGVGDGMKLVDNGNKKPIFEKLSTQSTIFVHFSKIYVFALVVIYVVATLKGRMSLV
jgi:hypothetical protein